MLTVAERSGYRATSTHAEVMAYIQGLIDRRDPRLHVTGIGATPQGRTIPLLVLSSAGVTTPEQARALGRPVVLLQNCIHAGEVEGKEAALMLVRDLLDRDEGLLEAITLLVLPVFNPDGNDAMDTENRALQIEKLMGQDGPPKVGTRVNAAGINLNRDYIRHDSLEMRLLQQNLVQRWLPDLTVDSHATNGSVHRFAMTYDIPHTVESGRPEPIAYMREVFTPAVSAAVRRNFGVDSGWYGNFVEDERVLDALGEADPTSPVGEGWMTYPHHPRFGSHYRGLSNRLDLLLECYSYLTYEERVRTTYGWHLEILRAAAARATEIRDLLLASRTPPDRIAVQYTLKAFPEPIEILTRTPRTRSGAPTSVKIPHIANFVGTHVVDRPPAYLVPARLETFLRGHGLTVGPAHGSATVQVGRFAGADQAGGRKILEASGYGVRRAEWETRDVSVPPNMLLLPTDQPLGALAVYLAEPESDDGLVENGFVPVPTEGGEFEVLRVVG